MKAMETVHDLIEEAKLRTVWWALCIFAVSYFLTRKRFLILVLCYAHKLFDYISLSNSCNYTIFFCLFDGFRMILMQLGLLCMYIILKALYGSYESMWECVIHIAF